MIFPSARRVLQSLAAAALVCAAASSAQSHSTWSDYGGSPDGAQYSSLQQVNHTNVAKLQRAWSFPTGDNRGYLFNPLVVGSTMYVLAHDNSVVALDAANGRELWTH
ncbi:MAG: PQQ-binding-like beta-propeller repeat protein, partial [Janthinobacterium lividum]